MRARMTQIVIQENIGAFGLVKSNKRTRGQRVRRAASSALSAHTAQGFDRPELRRKFGPKRAGQT